ncbi:hypothetical protein Bca101_026457 [Brassica carinata]
MNKTQSSQMAVHLFSRPQPFDSFPSHMVNLHSFFFSLSFDRSFNSNIFQI